MRDVASARRLGVPAVAILTAELERLAVDTARATGIDPIECTVTVGTPLFGLSRSAVASQASIAADAAAVRLGVAQPADHKPDESRRV